MGPPSVVHWKRSGWLLNLATWVMPATPSAATGTAELRPWPFLHAPVSLSSHRYANIVDLGNQGLISNRACCLPPRSKLVESVEINGAAFYLPNVTLHENVFL